MKFYSNFCTGTKMPMQKFRDLADLHPICSNSSLKRKIIMRVKLVFIIALATMLQVSASTFAQKININQTNISLEKALKLIRQQSGYDILFDAKIIQKAGNINLSLNNADLKEALKNCLAGNNLTYSIEENTVLIKEKSFLERVKEEVNLKLYANEISGAVYAGNINEPLVGATVTLKRTKKTVYTNSNGLFILSDVLSSDTIICNYIGYITKHVPVGKEKSFFIKLEEATNSLDAVVVQGYGKTTQRLTTGNIVRVSAKDIEKQVISNPLMALQGAVPGLQITSLDGSDAGMKKVELRGRKTINSNFSSEPLYIIDGVPLTVLSKISNTAGKATQSHVSLGLDLNGISSSSGISPLYSINPSDIESIEVLKDADATAIYGSRGGNGVILITTKKGQSGKTLFNVNVKQGIKMVVTKFNFLNTEQYLDMRRESFANDKISPTVINAPELKKYDQSRYTDWQDYAYGNSGKWTTLEGSLSGGTAQTSFRLSAALDRTKDITTVSGLNQRISASTAITHTSLDQRFKLNVNATYSATENSSSNLQGITLSPANAPAVYDEKGALNFDAWATNMTPFANLKTSSKANSDFLNAGANLGYNPIKNFNFNFNVGYNFINSVGRKIVPLSSINLVTDPSSVSYISNSINQVKNFIVEPQANYYTSIGQGKLTALLGASYQNNNTSSIYTLARDFKSDEQLGSLNQATTFTNTEGQLHYKYAGIFARLNYNWADKYILNLNGRRDGSSKFGPGNRYGNFGSVGASWILSEEEWLKKHLPKAISFLKLRGSYGVVGYDGIGDYKYLTQWGATLDGSKLWPYDGQTGVIPQIQPNDDFHWQRTKQAEIGLNLNFFKDRLSFEFVRYSNYSDNQLLSFPTPNYTGFNTIILNSPAKVRNSGIEFSLNARIIDTDKFGWNSSFNFSKNDNKLVDYPNLEESPYYNTYKIGQSLNNLYLFKSLGVDPQTGEYTYYDANGDGKITEVSSGPSGTGIDDRIVALNTSPDFFGGMMHSFRYKNFSLSGYFNYSKQKAVLSSKPSGNANTGVYLYENTWRKPGDQAIYSKFTTQTKLTNNYFATSDGYYVNADFIRLKSVQLAYNLPEKALKALKLSRLSVNISAENIFVISNYPGIDPEITQYSAIPQTRTIIVGLNCTF